VIRGAVAGEPWPTHRSTDGGIDMGEALELAKTYYDAFARGDLDAADAVYDDGCTFDLPVGTLSKAEHRGMSAGFRAAFPDAHMEIDRVLDLGPEVFVEGRFVGTHFGDLVSPDGTIPATGNHLDLRFAEYYRAEGGHLVAQHSYWDQAALGAQLAPRPATVG
jgi:ketosteroid isomerase-like protein